MRNALGQEDYFFKKITSKHALALLTMRYSQQLDIIAVYGSQEEAILRLDVAMTSAE